MTADVAKIEFGRYLQDSRRSRGVSLEVVSHQTKITPNILRQIENENMNQLPAPAFVKGFIKAFASAVGANPDEAVNRFETYLACQEKVCSIPPAPPKSSYGKQGFALAIALFMATIGATLYMAHRMQSPSSAAPAPPTAATEPAPSEPSLITVSGTVAEPSAVKTTPVATEAVAAVAPEVAPKEVPDTVSIAPVTAPAQERPAPVGAAASLADTPSQRPEVAAPGLELRMTAAEATWLKVVSDNQSPKEFLLQIDEDVTLVAESGFDLVIGNAGGVRLMLNDQPVPLVGKKGQVVSLHLP